MLTRIQETKIYDDVMRLAVHLPNGQTQFYCPFHGPMIGEAIQTPRHQCPHCWCMFFLKLEAMVPPENREEWADSTLQVMVECDRLVQRGEFDLDIPRSPIKTEIILDPTDADYFKAQEANKKQANGKTG